VPIPSLHAKRRGVRAVVAVLDSVLLRVLVLLPAMGQDEGKMGNDERKRAIRALRATLFDSARDNCAHWHRHLHDRLRDLGKLAGGHLHADGSGEFLAHGHENPAQLAVWTGMRHALVLLACCLVRNKLDRRAVSHSSV
jgi:hypothetical protein